MAKYLVIVFLFLSFPGFTQDSVRSNTSIPSRFIYETDLLPAEFHQNRRQVLRDLMPENSVAILFANPVRNRSNDVDYEYHQNPDFYYLTGHIEPHAMLLVFKEEQNFDSVKTNEIIFVQPRDPSWEIWNGKRLGTDGAKNILKINTAWENFLFADFRIQFSEFDHIWHVLPPDEMRDDPLNRGDLFSLTKHLRLKADTMLNLPGRMELLEAMASLRQVKQPEEITLLRKAIDITCQAQTALMQSLKPGMTEYQAEALVEFIFKENGAEHPGFPSILGGGENSCILHYISNRKTMKDGELLVSDIGAEYHGYTADVSRTIPVNGTFSKEQKIIYNIVLEAQQAGIKSCLKGNRFWKPHNTAKSIIGKRLKEIGLIDSEHQVGKYFMHGTSHYLGLDVHDVGLYGPLKPGNVITVEPGIYIPEGSDCDPKWWNIGVRIEDDILITEGEPEVLSDCVPKTVEEIEALMEKSSSADLEIQEPVEGPMLEDTEQRKEEILEKDLKDESELEEPEVE